jgi:methylase of polypeptide subunit release factors
VPPSSPLLDALRADGAWSDLADHVAGGVGGRLGALLDDVPRDPHALGALHAALRRRDDGLGAVYTPPPLAARVVHGALACARPEPSVLDPACGGGVFLVEAARALWAAAGASTAAERVTLLRRRLRGWDVDPGAVTVARLALAAAAGAPGADLADVVVVRDALDGPVDRPFDVVVGNPPWVDAADQASRAPERRAALAARFATARGAWDLFCVFAERGLELLAPGGVHAFVVPDRLATAPYAAAIRRRLHGSGRRLAGLEVLDGDGFEAAVRPVAYVSVEGEDDAVPVARRGAVRTLRLPRDGAPWPLPEDDADERLLAALAGATPLGALAAVWGAATVAEAYDLRDALVDGDPGPGAWPAVNTGTLDPLVSLWGVRPLRYLGRSLPRPVVDPHALPARRRAQAAAPKLVVGGIGRRLEPFVDPTGGLVALKSTVVVLPGDPADLGWLAGWLASTAATRAFRARAAGLRGGFVHVGPPALGALPVPAFEAAERARLAELVAALSADPADTVAWSSLDGVVDGALGLRDTAAG